MARGFVSGILWGGIAGVSAIAVLSVATKPPTGPQVVAVAPNVVTPPQVAPAQPSAAPLASAETAPVIAQKTPDVQAPAVQVVAELPSDGMNPPAPPQTSAQTSLSAPQDAPADASDIVVSRADVVIRTPQALAPMAPAARDTTQLDTTPAEPRQAPKVADAPIIPGLRPLQAPSEDVAVADVTVADVAAEDVTVPDVIAEDVAAEDVAAEDVAAADVIAENVTAENVAVADVAMADATVDVTVDAPMVDAPTVETPLVNVPAAVVDETTTGVDVAQLIPPLDDTAPAVVTEPTVPPAPASAAPQAATSQQVITLVPVDPPAAVTEAGLQTPSRDIIAPLPTLDIETASALPRVNSRIGTQVGSLLDRDTQGGVVIRRPGSASLGEQDEGIAEDVVTQADTTSADGNARPVRQFAAPFTPEADKPLMSIVLIDDGTSPVSGDAGIAALRGFPYTLSFAVDANLPDAAARMESFRKEGFEVLAMIDLPQGAQPGDAEIAFGAILPELDKVVGVLEGTQTGFQGSRDVADQVTSILLQTGHGLLTQDNGLNTMPKLARKEGVPAEAVFRDFDSKGQTAAVIRRFLDQAAFKAGQEGAVVMLGRLRADTVSALLLWGLQDRAGKVSLAPISSVLLREE